MKKKNLNRISNALVIVTLFILLLNIDYSYLDWKDYATIIGCSFIVVVLILTSLRNRL